MKLADDVVAAFAAADTAPVPGDAVRTGVDCPAAAEAVAVPAEAAMMSACDTVGLLAEAVAVAVPERTPTYPWGV